MYGWAPPITLQRSQRPYGPRRGPWWRLYNPIMLHLAYNRVGVLLPPTDLSRSEFGTLYGPSCSKWALVEGTRLQEGPIVHNRDHTAWDGLWFRKWDFGSQRGHLKLMRPAVHNRGSCVMEGPLNSRSGVLGALGPLRGPFGKPKYPSTLQGHWDARWLSFLLGCSAAVGAPGTPLRKPRGSFHDARPLLYTMGPLSGLQGPRGSRSPLCGKNGSFHAARPSVVHSGPLMGFSGPLSGFRDPFREPKALPYSMAPVVRDGPFFWRPTLSTRGPAGPQRPQTANDRGLSGPCWMPDEDLCQGPKKIRDPGFAESKVWDLDGSWTLHVLFFVGLWKPRTSKFWYAARPWKPKTSRFWYEARPWKPRTSKFQ